MKWLDELKHGQLTTFLRDLPVGQGAWATFKKSKTAYKIGFREGITLRRTKYSADKYIVLKIAQTKKRKNK